MIKLESAHFSHLFSQFLNHDGAGFITNLLLDLKQHGTVCQNGAKYNPNVKIIDKKSVSKWCIILLGIYQIAGGLLGLQAVFNQSISFILIHLFAFTIVIGLFIFSIISGIYLLRGKNIVKGLKLSLINQAFQLVQFEILGNGIYFVAGSYVALKITFISSFTLSFDYSLFRSSCFINFLVDSNLIYVSVNLVSASLLIFLWYTYHQYINHS